MDSNKVKVLARWTSGRAVVAWDDRLADPSHPRGVTWPVIAHGSYRDHDGPYRGEFFESQANRWWRVDVRVLQHADGRAVVYGVYRHYTAFPGERDFVAHADALVGKDTNLVEAIRAVGAELTRAAREDGRDFGGHIAAAVRDCIADLPVAGQATGAPYLVTW